MKHVLHVILAVSMFAGTIALAAPAGSAAPQPPADEVTVDQTLHNAEKATLSARGPVKPQSVATAHKVGSSLRQAGARVATLAAGDTFVSDPAGLSSTLVRIDKTGRLQVDVWVDDTAPAVITGLEEQGLLIERSNLEAKVVEGWLAYDKLDVLAALPNVRLISAPSYPDVDTGSVNSQGDAILRANLVRSNLGITGAGAKACAMSDGVNHRINAQASGDLPGSIDVRKAGDGDEGTAMLEIVHDLAPGAALGFYGPTTAVDMANGIRILRNAGCNVIVDDLSFNGEPYYEDGQINQAMSDVMINSNVVYASSAGNVAQNHWQGTFAPGTFVSDMGYANRWSGVDEGFGLQVANNGFFVAYLQWNDRWGASGNDYDIFLVDSTLSNLLAFSDSTQDGTGNPVEAFAYQNTTGSTQTVYLFAFRFAGSANSKLQLYTRGAGVDREYNVTAGSVTPNHHTIGIFASAAIAAADAGNDTIESFSARGPVEHYFPSYELRNKPDITGIDGVSVTGAGGFGSPFYGTSASAPHIAAIAALVRSARPSATRSSVYAAIANTAVDLGTSGYDTTFGYGRADAYSAVLNILGGPPTLGADPATLGFLICPEEHAVPAVLSVTNPSLLPLTWTASEAAPWLAITPLTGTASLGSAGHISVSVGITGLSYGVYNATITLSSSTPIVVGSPKQVAVHFSYQPSCQRLYMPLIVKNR